MRLYFPLKKGLPLHLLPGIKTKEREEQKCLVSIYRAFI